MPIDEKLRAVVSYTTPGGNALSWTNNVDLLIRDTSAPIIRFGDIGCYLYYWGNRMQNGREIIQYYVGAKTTKNNGAVSVDKYVRSGFSNGFKWEFTGGEIVETHGLPATTGLLVDTVDIYGNVDYIIQSIELPINITRPNGDGVLHNYVTIVFRNLRTNVLHSFTFQRGVTYGTGGTYNENTPQFKDLRARIGEIGTYDDRVEIESVTIT